MNHTDVIRKDASKFKVGDRVRFVYDPDQKYSLEDMGIDVERVYTILSTYVNVRGKDVADIDGKNGDGWGLFWFELDKSQIIYNIIQEL